MPKIELPAGDSAASVSLQADAGRATCATIDWRQLSHELRTPLNAILGNTELLLDGSSGPLSAQARACLGEVQTAGRQLLRQVQLLLAWSELCLGRPTPDECPFDLITLVRDALAEHSGSAQVEPRDARLVISGDRSSLPMLVAEILALNGATARHPPSYWRPVPAAPLCALPGPALAQARQVRCRSR
jgi:signal transduction histidine kinase